MPPPSAPIPIPGSSSKKRQRDQMSNGTAHSPSADENGDIDVNLPLTRTPTISPDPFHGAGLPTINPFTGQQESPEKQMFESRLEEGLVTGRQDTADQVDGPGDESSKRQCIREESTSNVIDFATMTPSTGSHRQGFQTPQADEYSRILGVGWTKLGEDPDVLAAARGYCRYIENHYPLTNVEILAKSRSLDSYLVKTSGGYYLFKDELTEGRLIAKEFEVTMARLGGSDIRFDGEGPIHAAAETSDAASASANRMGPSDMEMSDIA